MSRKTINLIIVFAVVVALGGGLFFLTRLPPPEGAESSSASIAEVAYMLGGGDAAINAKKITVSNENGSYSIDVQNAESESSLDKTYLVEGLERQKLSSLSVSSLVNACQSAAVRSTVEEGDANFATFGLDNPAATADIEYVDGSRATIMIGDRAPGSEGFYASTDRNRNVYLISTTTADLFLLDKFRFLDLALTTALANEQEVFTNATLGGTVRPQEIVVNALPEPDPSSNTGGAIAMSSHIINAPAELYFNNDTGNALINSAFGLSATAAVDVADSDAKLEQYGLKEPYSTLRVSGPEIPAFTLTCSAPDENGIVKIMKDTSSVVFTIAAESLPWLETQLMDIAVKLAIVPNIDHVASLTVDREGVVHSFLLEGEGDELKVTYNGADMPHIDSFRKFYQTIIGATYDSVPDEPLPEGLTPYLTYTYKYRDPARLDDVVSFYEGPARRMYITVNDGPEYLALTSYVNKVWDDIPKLLAGEEIRSYY